MMLNPATGSAAGDADRLRKDNEFPLNERKKIQYLLARVSRSPYLFVRNGREYEGPKAASHLRRKYASAFRRVDTAEEFVRHIASSSSMTGKPYMIKTPDGQYHPAGDVFGNELDRFENRSGGRGAAREAP